MPEIYLSQMNGEPLRSLPSSRANVFARLLGPGFLPVSLLSTPQVREIQSLAGQDLLCTTGQSFA